MLSSWLFVLAKLTAQAGAAMVHLEFCHSHLRASGMWSPPRYRPRNEDQNLALSRLRSWKFGIYHPVVPNLQVEWMLLSYSPRIIVVLQNQGMQFSCIANEDDTAYGPMEGLSQA